MNRIKAAVDQYDNRKKKNRRQGTFYAHDLADIIILSNNDLVTAARIALKAGYMIGYKAGKRRKSTCRTK